MSQIITPDIGGGGLNKGDGDGFVIKYDTTTRVIISSGIYEVSGSLFTLAANDTHLLTSLVSAFDYHYIYLDKSAGSPSIPVFYDETTEPDFDPVKNGHYHPTNTQDRVVGQVKSPSGSAIIDYFDDFGERGSYIRTTIVKETSALLQDPDGSFDIPNVTETGNLVPVNAVSIWAETGNGGLGNLFVSLTTVEKLLVNSSAIVTFGANGVLSAQAWLALGISRNLRILGPDANANNMFLQVLGYGFNR